MAIVGADVALADQLQAFAAERELRTLVIDLERVPGIVRAYDPKINYLHAGLWEALPRTICWAAKQIGKRPVEFASVWTHDDDYLAERSWQLFDEADLVVTYYGKGADVPWLREQWARRGLGEPSPWTDIDLYSTVRSRFRLTHKSLNAAAEMLGVAVKVDKYDFRVADAAVAGDPAAQRRIKRYNVGDIHSTEAVYWSLLPHIKPHPHVAPSRYMDQMCCPRCASTDVHRDGTYTPGVYVYAAYRCHTCKGSFKAEFHHKGPSVRAL